MPGSVRIGLAWLFAAPFLVLAQPTGPSLWAGAALAIPGLALRAWAAGSIDKNADLAISGPYAFTRNPLYLGSLLVGLGLAVSGGHWVWPLAFGLFFAAVYVPTVRRESRELSERFGERFRDYSARVPALAVRLMPYRPSGAGPMAAGVESGFRWSRYARHREWEAALGWAAVVAVLALKAQLGG